MKPRTKVDPYVPDPTLREWYENLSKGVTERKPISIIILDRVGSRVRMMV